MELGGVDAFHLKSEQISVENQCFGAHVSQIGCQNYLSKLSIRLILEEIMNRMHTTAAGN